MVPRWVAVLCFLLLIFMGSCSLPPGASGPSGSTSSGSSRSPEASNPCTRMLEFAGTITAIRRLPHGEGLSLLVHGKLEKGDPDDQFLAHIDQEQQTKIYDQRKPQCPSVSPTAFQPGQQIRVQSTGVILQSYPGQIDAVEVIIVS